MAIETWWHGQEHNSARMGGALWHTRWQYTPSLTSNTGVKGTSRKSQEWQWPCATISTRSLRRIRSCSDTPSKWNILRTVLLVIVLHIRLSTAAFINFDNCLDPGIVNSDDPKLLQFVPLFVWATFNTSAKSYNLNVTAYGNIDGLAFKQPYPNQSDPQWTNPNDTVGKIPDVYGSGPSGVYTTFTTDFNVLDYTPYSPAPARFCNTSSLRACPLAPVFDFNGSE